MKEMIIRRMTEMSSTIARAYGGEASTEFQNNTAITYNDIELTRKTLPSLEKVVGKENILVTKAVTGGEDFSFFQEEIPGFYFFLGGMTPGNTNSYPHHTPDFVIDEDALIIGVKALTQITLDYLH